MSNTTLYTKSPFSLSDRMRGYENVTKVKLTNRLPVIVSIHIHIDEYEPDIKIPIINNITKYVADRTDSCEFALVTNNIISLLLINYSDIDTDIWENNDLQSIVSQAVTMSTRSAMLNIGNDDIFLTTANAFTIPKDEVTNYMIWKQNDLIGKYITATIVDNDVAGIKSISECKAMHMRMKDMIKLLDDNLSSSPYNNWHDVIKNTRFGYYYTPISDELIHMPYIKSNKSIVDNVVYDKFKKELKINKEKNQ